LHEKAGIAYSIVDNTMALNTTSKQVLSGPCRFSSYNNFSLGRTTICNFRTWSTRLLWFSKLNGWWKLYTYVLWLANKIIV